MLDLLCNQVDYLNERWREMAKFAFAVSLLFVLVNGGRAWGAVFAGDHAGVVGFTNSVMFAGIVMMISLLFIIKGNTNK